MAEVETTIRNVNGSDDDHEEDNIKRKEASLEESYQLEP